MRRTRPSTLRVYQFRHRRVTVGSIDRRRASALELSFRPGPGYSYEHTFENAGKGGAMVELNLTKRQREIFDFIKRYAAEHGYPPTARDIGKARGRTSSSTGHAPLASLENPGLLRRDPPKPRALELLGEAARKVVRP